MKISVAVIPQNAVSHSVDPEEKDPANTVHSHNAGLMLGQSRRRLANIGSVYRAER